MRLKHIIYTALLAVVVTGCAGKDPMEQERRAAYEQQKKRDQAERAQRESDAATRRMDRVIGK